MASLILSISCWKTNIIKKQIDDNILKRFKVLGCCHLFRTALNLCSLGRPSIGLSQDVVTTVFG